MDTVKTKLNRPQDLSGGTKIKINMETKIITIRRTVEIAVSVPVNETQDDVERWAIRNLVPDFLNTESEIRHWISDVRFMDNDDEDQDSFVVVSWPECQEPPCNGELRKIEDFEINEETLCSYGV